MSLQGVVVAIQREQSLFRKEESSFKPFDLQNSLKLQSLLRVSFVTSEEKQQNYEDFLHITT